MELLLHRTISRSVAQTSTTYRIKLLTGIRPTIRLRKLPQRVTSQKWPGTIPAPTANFSSLPARPTLRAIAMIAAAIFGRISWLQWPEAEAQVAARRRRINRLRTVLAVIQSLHGRSVLGCLLMAFATFPMFHCLLGTVSIPASTWFAKATSMADVTAR